MRDNETLLAEFDDPTTVTPPAVHYDSLTNYVRERLELEVSIEIRDLLVEIKDVLDECKDELVEIKENTA